MINDANSRDETGLCVSVTDNILSKQDALNLVKFLARNNVRKYQEDTEYFSSKPFSFRRLMLGLCGQVLSDFKSEIIDNQMTSFHCLRSKVHFVIQSDIKLNINNCDLSEFTNSIQLLFSPEVIEIDIYSEGSNYVNCLITLKLAVS